MGLKKEEEKKTDRIAVDGDSPQGCSGFVILLSPLTEASRHAARLCGKKNLLI